MLRSWKMPVGLVLAGSQLSHSLVLEFVSDVSACLHPATFSVTESLGIALQQFLRVGPLGPRQVLGDTQGWYRKGALGTPGGQMDPGNNTRMCSNSVAKEL
eukprot:TRINITY_DN4494_c0_g1_i9.p1 TRINITY_DN4494_c0_g1~~TRINITY_DN4494_c0_g1_i9.p1  ORF type:complete len:101 (-),score=6.88 TRINITY_DN4494_c0_g1_i9:135-437(-)